MALPRIPGRVRTHQHRRAQYALTAVHLVRRAWDRSMTAGGVWSQQGRTFSQQANVVVSAAQVATATESSHYVQQMATGAGLAGGAAGLVLPASFAGVAGNGLTLTGLFDHAIVRAGQRYNELVDLPVEKRVPIGPPALRLIAREDPAQLALAEQRSWVDHVVATVMADTARAVEQAQTIAFPEIEGYVRVINPPCCSRCIVLAGKFYRWDAAFQRHPGCDCSEVPASEADASDLKQDPQAYFHSLSPAEQDQVFTKAGAEAIRLGADPAQVVNARQGMYTATGRSGDFLATHVGITRQGAFGRINAQREAQGLHKLPHRLMPEDLIVPGDRKQTIERLRTHGYFGPMGAPRPTKLSGSKAEKNAAAAAKKAAAEVPAVTPPAPTAGGTIGPPINPPDRPSVFGEVPDPRDENAWTAYWERRKAALPASFNASEMIPPLEVEFAERMHDLGQRLTWISQAPSKERTGGDGKLLPVNDFDWLGSEWEHKGLEHDTPVDHIHIGRQVTKGTKKGKLQIVVDVGDRALPPGTIDALQRYNLDEKRPNATALWVMSFGVLYRVDLLPGN